MFEFKRRDPEREDLERAADEALAQIEARGYAVEQWARGVERVVAVAVALDGKRLLVRHQLLMRP